MRALMAGTILAGCLAGAATLRAQQASTAATAPKLLSDIEVTVRHLDGKEETFKKEVASLELIVTPDGSIRYVHLILIGGTEKDTHLWYNYNNIASLRYRFLHITGKGKVAIKQITPFESRPAPGIAEKIPQVEVDDYK
jgi:hypothetical protein